MGSRSSLTFKFEKAPLAALQRGETVKVRGSEGEIVLARPSSGAVFLFDEKHPGLAARVPAVGEVRYYLYAWINGQAVKRSLGAVDGPEGYSVERARLEAVKEKARVSEGRVSEEDSSHTSAAAPNAVTTNAMASSRLIGGWTSPRATTRRPGPGSGSPVSTGPAMT